MSNLRTSRLVAVAAVMIALLMVGSPASIIGIDGVDPVGTASAGDGSRQFKIGVVDMTVSTLNPNTYTMVAEGMIIFPLYSYLIQWDSKGENVVGDLAKKWWVSPDGLTWEFDLVENAYWVEYDPVTEVLTKGPQVTSEDVEWSVLTLAGDDRSRLNSIWPEGIIADTWTDGDFHFGMSLTGPFVPMQDSLMTQLIFPKYIWESEDFINFDNMPLVCSGPFYYKMDGLPDAGFATLARNPYWYGEEAYGWQLHVDEFIMCRYDDAGSCWAALKTNAIDSMMGVEPSVFVGDLPDQPDLVGFHQSNGFVYEFNLNQLTDEMRKEVGGSLNAGENSQLLLNHSIKKAISMAVDRNDIIDDDLFGYGEWTTTLVPSQNPMSHSYGQDDHDCILDPGVTGPAEPDPVDRVAARAILWEAGWRYDGDGEYYSAPDSPGFADVCPLYNATDSDPNREALSFRFFTLNTGTTWTTIATKIVDWCGQIGVELNLDVRSVNEMNTAWYSANYDVWLWDWVFGPYTEAASGVLVVLTTDAIGTDSDIYLSNPEFDALYEEAIREMDFEKRREILYDMQDIIYLNRGCQALAFREDLYAFNTIKWANVADLDLNNDYYMLPDVWPTWLCMELDPTDNAAPTIGSIEPSMNTASGYAEVGTPVTFTALGVSDDYQLPSELNYTWIWDSGGERWVDTDSSVDYTFTSDGVYTVTLVVKETAPTDPDPPGVSHADYLSSYMTYRITVHDMSNSPPHDLEMTMSVPDPTAGEMVTFSGSAVDDEDEDLYYSWDFGDGTVLAGQEVEHSFDADGSYTVTLMVDDHRYGEPGSRPATLPELVAVGPNHAPSISVPDYGSVTVKTEQTYTVLASDPDPRDELLFTWDWGDGTTSETTEPSATHTYDWKDTYTITVYADDQTGLAGHRVQDSGTVYVVQAGNAIPVIAEYYVDMDEAYVGQTLTFFGSAADGDGDPLTFTFDFDDGTEAVEEFGGTGPLDIVECSVEKSYSAPGVYSVYLYVTDDIATATSLAVVVSIEANAAPEILEFAPDAYGDTGAEMMFAAVALDDDGDPLTYTWDWDDGTTDVTAIGTTTHTFDESGTYTVGVTVDDGKGLSDYAEAVVEVNAVPYIDPLLSQRTVNRDQEYTYSVSAFDDDMDSLTVMWDFDDGTDFVFGASVTHIYTVNGTYNRTVYVWDDFLEHMVTHNVSSTAPVIVKDPSDDSPPDVDPLDDIYAVAGEELELWVYATDDNDEGSLIFTWDFDDGSDLYVGEPPVYYTYAAGTYNITVWVSDLSGIPANNVSVGATIYVAEDMPPVADAGGDREVDEDTLVDFTGEDSTDEFPIPVDGYAWTVNDYDGAHTYDTMEMSHTFSEPGVYTVELVVTDSIGQESDPDTVTVTVLDVTPPEVDAGPDQTVHNGTTVVFAGSAEDNYDESPSFEWRFIYDEALQTLTGESPSFTFDALAVYTVELRVEDAAGNIGSDDMTLVVTDEVDPIADAGADQTVTAGDEVTFDGSGSYDEDSSVDAYTWDFDYDGAPEELTGVNPTFTFDIVGEYTVTLTVEDGYGNSATDTVVITVEEPPVTNEPPVADAGVDQTVTVGDEVTFNGTDSSDDVAVVNYTWTFTYDGAPEELYDAEPTFTFDIVGEYTVTLTVEDAEGETDTDTMTVTVEEEEEPPETNDPPVADAGDDQTVTVGDEVTFDGAGSSDDAAVVSYTWTFEYDGAPEELTGTSPSFTFDIAGVYTVTLTVEDAEGETDTDTMTVTVEEEEEPVDDDDDKSFIESYGLPIALLVALIVVVIVALMVMKGRKGGKSPAAQEPSAEEPVPPSDEGSSL